MEIISSDYKKSVDVGTGDMLQAILSTMITNFSSNSYKTSHAFRFLETGSADYENVNVLRDEFKEIIAKLKALKPEQAVYDYKHPKRKGPWVNGYYDGISSCADLFTTNDSKNLLKEIMDILNYAEEHKTNISFI